MNGKKPKNLNRLNYKCNLFEFKRKEQEKSNGNSSAENECELNVILVHLLINIPMVRWGIECICFQTNIADALVIHCCKIKGTSNVGEIRIIIVVYICV